ncbi:MAG TPA: hypothetical protein VMW56_18785 [Candidatus Margulisiibacteriota bacterium]|nr:hypothetical protein [Candidatus Margulisiibacteriota bacterium]
MLLVLASRSDASAATLVRRWRGHGARLLTCEDLSRRGWVWNPDVPDDGSLVLQEECVSLRSIRGVVSLLPSVAPSELPQIVAEEREYVASEMMAFLVAWLSSLRCRVINRPTPLCLTGPRLHHEQWLREAVRAGLSIHPTSRRVLSFAQRSAAGVGPPSMTDRPCGDTRLAAVLSVVAGRCVPAPTDQPVDGEIVSGLCRLAAAVRAGLLTASFVDVDGKLLFAGAAPIVDVSRADIADIMLEALGVVS